MDLVTLDVSMEGVFGKDPLAALSVVATPLLGMALGLLVWSKPRTLKAWCVFVAIASLLGLVESSGRLAVVREAMALLYLLPVVAGLSLLAQPSHPENRPACIATLGLLGLGLGVLVCSDGVGWVLLVILFGLVGALLYGYRRISGPVPRLGIVACALGAACAIAALVTAPPISSLAALVSCAVLMPLAPFHLGYVAAFRGLPGNLPAFLALLLPTLGYHELLVQLPTLTDWTLQTLVALSLVGMLYGSLKALMQSRVRLVVAYAGLSFFSILWWYVAVTRSTPLQTAVYLGSVGLATSGLLLAWHAIQARYGDVDLRSIRGLVERMPRFSVSISLLALAAMGLPPFGVYAGFMGMLLTPSLPASGALIAIVAAWLAASWYLLELVQRLLFGQHRSDLRYDDLRWSELCSLLVIVALLAVLGVSPSRILDAGANASPTREASEPVAWID